MQYLCAAWQEGALRRRATAHPLDGGVDGQHQLLIGIVLRHHDGGHVGQAMRPEPFADRPERVGGGEVVDVVPTYRGEGKCFG